MEFQVQADDLSRYVLQLEAAAGQVSKAGRRNAGKWARVAAGVARQRVPVDTGTLQRSIGVREGVSGIMELTAEAPYAGFVEFGTSRMRPRPYMRPAMAAVRKQFQEEIAQIGASLLGSPTAARQAMVGAVPRGTSLSPGGGARQAAMARVEGGGGP